MLSNTLQKIESTHTVFSTYLAIIVLQIKRFPFEKWFIANRYVSIYADKSILALATMDVMQGKSYTTKLLHSVHCAADGHNMLEKKIAHQ